MSQTDSENKGLPVAQQSAMHYQQLQLMGIQAWQLKARVDEISDVNAHEKRPIDATVDASMTSTAATAETLVQPSTDNAQQSPIAPMSAASTSDDMHLGVDSPSVEVDEMAVSSALAAKVLAHTLPTPDYSDLDAQALTQKVRACQACALRQSCTQPILATGDMPAKLMVVVDRPNREQDQAQSWFYSDSGQLLYNMVSAIQFAAAGRLGKKINEVMVTSLVKCRPSKDGAASAEEVAQCSAYLKRQIELCQPQAILVLGQQAAQFLLHSEEPLAVLRQSTHRYQGIPLAVSYQQDSLVSQPQNKQKTWQDMCALLGAMQ